MAGTLGLPVKVTVLKFDCQQVPENGSTSLIQELCPRIPRRVSLDKGTPVDFSGRICFENLSTEKKGTMTSTKALALFGVFCLNAWRLENY